MPGSVWEMIREVLSPAPWVAPTFAVAVLAAVLLSRPLARAGVGSARTAGLPVVALGLVAAAALTPNTSVPAPPAGLPPSCSLDLGCLPDLASLLQLSGHPLNIALFVPLGFAVALVRPMRSFHGLVLLALALPVAVEAAQALLTVLG